MNIIKDYFALQQSQTKTQSFFFNFVSKQVYSESNAKMLMISTEVSIIPPSLYSASSHTHFKTAIKKSGKAMLRTGGC